MSQKFFYYISQRHKIVMDSLHYITLNWGSRKHDRAEFGIQDLDAAYGSMVSPAQQSMTSCRQQQNEQVNIQTNSSPYECAHRFRQEGFVGLRETKEGPGSHVTIPLLWF